MANPGFGQRFINSGLVSKYSVVIAAFMDSQMSLFFAMNGQGQHKPIVCALYPSSNSACYIHKGAVSARVT